MLMVNTSCGPIRGVESRTHPVTEYLGLRYAIPPLAQRRWTRAESIGCYWNGTLLADDVGPACMQMSSFHFPVNQSEDCLRLNVYVPNRRVSDSMPVVFWIYGGSNVIGYNTMYSNVSALADSMNAIVVAPNYRVGSLGFLALRSLSLSDPLGISGNYGLSDLYAALLWVQENIKAFGGDPLRVTLLGQSSGGTNIFALLANSTTGGGESDRVLFRAAISLSGSPNITMSLHHAEDLNERHALARSPCANVTNVRDCLYGLSSQDANALFGDAYDVNVFRLCPFVGGCPSTVYLGLPVVDGYTVPNSLERSFGKIPGHVEVVLFQSLRGETDLTPNLALVNVTSRSDYLKYLEGVMVGNNQYPSELVLKLYHEYFGGDGVTAQRAWNAMITDMGVTFGTEHLARWASKSDGPTVLLGLVECGPGEPLGISVSKVANATMPFHEWDYMAATRSWDMMYIQGGVDRYVPTASDERLGDLLREQWAQIVAGGGPPPWKSYDIGTKVTGLIKCNGVEESPNHAKEVKELYRKNLKPLESFWWVD